MVKAGYATPLASIWIQIRIYFYMDIRNLIFSNGYIYRFYIGILNWKFDMNMDPNFITNDWISGKIFDFLNCEGWICDSSGYLHCDLLHVRLSSPHRKTFIKLK